MVVEPCIFCDGEGSFDFIESIDSNGTQISLADECLESIDHVDQHGRSVPWRMLTIDECNLLTERCVVCHQDNDKSDAVKNN